MIKNCLEFLNTDHHEHYLTSKEALNLIPKMQNIYCEPFGDSSIVPTYLISKIARIMLKLHFQEMVEMSYLEDIIDIFMLIDFFLTQNLYQIILEN